MFAVMFRRTIASDIVQGIIVSGGLAFVTVAFLIKNSRNGIQFLYEYEIYLHVDF